jgi:hypothetical protein
VQADFAVAWSLAEMKIRLESNQVEVLFFFKDRGWFIAPRLWDLKLSSIKVLKY